MFQPVPSISPDCNRNYTGIFVGLYSAIIRRLHDEVINIGPLRSE